MTSAEPVSSETAGWDEVTVPVAGCEMALLRGGTGAPVLLLPKDNGHPPGNAFANALAESFTVYYPWYPGFHGSPDVASWEWLSNVRDLAVTQRQLLESLALDRVSIVGIGFGGWVAAEMATVGSRGLDAMVLVNPMGIKPLNGYIYDQFLFSSEAYARHGFRNQEAFDALYGPEPEFEQLDAWESDRGMTSRLAWKPYMYNPTLPRLLQNVTAPTLVISAEADEVVPPECALMYKAALPNAELETMPDCGHALDAEYPEALAAAVVSFLNRTARR